MLEFISECLFCRFFQTSTKDIYLITFVGHTNSPWVSEHESVAVAIWTYCTAVQYLNVMNGNSEQCTCEGSVSQTSFLRAILTNSKLSVMACNRGILRLFLTRKNCPLPLYCTYPCCSALGCFAKYNELELLMVDTITKVFHARLDYLGLINSQSRNTSISFYQSAGIFMISRNVGKTLVVLHEKEINLCKSLV